MPDYIFTSQTDVIFTEANSLQELKKKFSLNKKLIAAGFRGQKNFGAKKIKGQKKFVVKQFWVNKIFGLTTFRG